MSFQEQVFGGYVVGAYAASKAHQNWNPDSESEFFQLLEADPRIAALELPWIGGLHPHDKRWLLANYPQRFDAVLTDIPFAMGRLSKDPRYGLASNDMEGRNFALADVARFRHDIRVMNDFFGRQVVKVVELHASGTRPNLSVDALKKSLEELSAWDWDGSSLVIEHCDAWQPSHQPEKGFLELSDEIAAIQQTAPAIGISLNWGRSVIELRDPERFVEHIKSAKAANLLRGIIFSGASDREGAFGPAWIDAHHHVQEFETSPLAQEHTLLTHARISTALELAGPLAWTGVKVGWPASIESSESDRAAMVSRALDALDQGQPLLVKASTQSI